MLEMLLNGGRVNRIGMWARMQDLPVARGYHAMDIIGSKIYVHGGRIDGVGSTTLSDMLFSYDLVTQEFTQLPSTLPARSEHTLNVIDGKLYVFGGHVTYASVFGLKELWCYDLTTNQWTQLADCLYGRKGHTANVVDGKLYAYGGSANTGDTGLQQIACYDPATNVWTQILSTPALNKRRYEHTSVVIDKKLYIHGGYTSTTFKDLWCYDTVNDTWTQLANSPKGRYRHTAVVIKGKMYVAMGDITTSSIESYCYDPVADTWSPLAVESKYIYAKAVAYDDKMYVYGGHSVPSALWMFTP